MNKSAKKETFKYLIDYSKDMKKNYSKQIFLSFIILSAVILSLSLVMGAGIGFNSPTAGTTIKGVQSFNVTNATSNTLNCSFSYAGSNFAFITNTSASQGSWNVSNNTALLTQSASASLTVTCANATVSNSSSITIGIDNTAPVCSFTLNSKDTKYLSPIGVELKDASTDLTTLTYNISLYDSNKNVQSSKSSASPSFSGTDFDEIGDFVVAQWVTDSASTTTVCANQTVFVRANDGDTQIVAGAVKQEEKSNTAIMFIILGAVVVLIIIAVAFFTLIAKAKRK